MVNSCLLYFSCFTCLGGCSSHKQIPHKQCFVQSVHLKPPWYILSFSTAACTLTMWMQKLQCLYFVCNSYMKACRKIRVLFVEPQIKISFRFVVVFRTIWSMNGLFSMLLHSQICMNVHTQSQIQGSNRFLPMITNMTWWWRCRGTLYGMSVLVFLFQCWLLTRCF